MRSISRKSSSLAFARESTEALPYFCRYDRLKARAKALEEEIKAKENEILAKNTSIATQAYDIKER